eukprot:3768766-Rhodomonas_salina.5
MRRFSTCYALPGTENSTTSVQREPGKCLISGATGHIPEIKHNFSTKCEFVCVILGPAGGTCDVVLGHSEEMSLMRQPSAPGSAPTLHQYQTRHSECVGQYQ